MRSSRIFLSFGLVTLLGAGGGLAIHRFVPRSPVARGVYVGERRVPDDRPVAEWLAARRDQAKERVVRFRYDDKLFESTLGEAGVTIDVEATLAEARRIGHAGSWWKRVRESERARRGETEVPLSWTVDEGKARALLATFAPKLAVAPVDARLDLAKHARIPEVPGRELNVDESLAQLQAARHEDEEIVDLLTRRVAAKVTLESLAWVNIEKQVSAYETKFSLFGTGAGRAVNIRNAASKLDGLVLGPGQIFSFNDRVGPRTQERGFALAPEIQGDELQMGFGGGTCQTSSTLYAAALFGALEIVERQSHSRPSSYTPMGLDATVSYPLADLKIRNTLPYPVMVHAYLPKPNVVRVEILGGDPVAKVDYAYGVSASESFGRKVTVKQNLQPGQRILHQKGIRGFDVTSIVKLHYFDGREDERHYFSGYRPAPEVYWVAPGYDLADLPPPKEGSAAAENPGMIPTLARIGG